MTVEEAIEVVAREVVFRALVLEEAYEWEDFPEIGQHDWDRVVIEIGQLAREVQDGGRFDEAYKLLAERAEASA